MNMKKTLAAFCIMILTAFFTNHLSHGNAVKPLKPFSTFPKKIGDWVGKEDRFDKRIYDVLGVDDSVLCNYISPDGKSIQLYVGYYESQREGDQIHSPKNCMPGAGWNIVQTSMEELPLLNGRAEKVKVIKLILENAGQRQIVLYWFQSRGRFIASEYKQKIYHVLDSITKRRTDGAFVRLIAPLSKEDGKTTPPYLKVFANLLVPILNQYIPS